MFFEAFGGLDPDMNCLLTVEEVWQGIGYLDETFWEDQVSALLRGADSDGDVQVSDEEINEMIASADTNSDGLIVYEEYCNRQFGQQTCIQAQCRLEE